MNYSLGVRFSATAGLLVMSILVLMVLLKAVCERKKVDKRALYTQISLPLFVGLFLCLYPAIIIAIGLLEELEQCRMLQIEGIIVYVAIAIASVALAKIEDAEEKLNTNSVIMKGTLIMIIVLVAVLITTLTIVCIDLKEFEEAAAVVLE